MLISDDDQAEHLIQINLERLERTLKALNLEEPVAAIALIVANEVEVMEPIAISVCCVGRWQTLRRPLGQPVSIELFMQLFSPNTWDHHDHDVLPSDVEVQFEELSAAVFDRWGEEENPAMQILTETARRLAHQPPVLAAPELVAFATDTHFDDEMLESVREASNASARAALSAAGLLPTSLDELVQ